MSHAFERDALMLVLLPAAAFGFTALALWRRDRQRDLRSALMVAAVVWGSTLVAITELLGHFGALTVSGLALSWLAVTVVAGFFARTAIPRDLSPATPRSKREIAAIVLLALPACVIVVLTGVIAVVSWPNSWDGMTYHLARVMHWQQNQSVAHYPTSISRQLFNPPWAEYGMLHLIVLGGDDRAGNLVQWFSMLGTVVGATLMARQLGANVYAQVFAGTFVATLPMGILQASSTQNHSSTALWLLCMGSALLKLRSQPASTARILEVGAGFGLAMLTKSTAAFYGGPLILLLLPLWPFRPLLLVKQGVIIGLVTLALCVPHFWRNYDAFGSPLAPVRQESTETLADFTLGVTNQELSVPVLASNVVRNAALHAYIPPLWTVRTVERAVGTAHEWLGVDQSDPRTTFFSRRGFGLAVTRVSELFTGNPLHLVLIALSTIMAGLLWWRFPAEAHRYGLSLLFGALVFCIVLKWQPIHSRLHLPLFVLWAPLAGLVLGRRFIVAMLLTVGLSVWAWPALAYSSSRPLLGEDKVFETKQAKQVFLNRKDLRDWYEEVAERIQLQGCRQVAIWVSGDGFEYPIWMLLPELRQPGGRLEHVPRTATARDLAARWPPFDPCAIMVVSRTDRSEPEFDLRDLELAWAKRKGVQRVDLYLRP